MRGKWKLSHVLQGLLSWNMLPKNRNLGATVIADFVKKCGDALLCLEELPLCFFSLNTANDALQL